MKKLLVVLVSMIMVFSLAACGVEKEEVEEEQKVTYTKAEVEVIVSDLETELDENQLVIAELETRISTLELNLGITNNNQDVLVHNYEVEIARLEALNTELQTQTE